ncbi:MAG: hypothetical protein K0S72_1982, partial [Arthrobacter sp.]|nr:hypothetical protein [Arthrobacter sp.]
MASGPPQLSFPAGNPLGGLPEGRVLPL